jgi:hypothetical protein
MTTRRLHMAEELVANIVRGRAHTTGMRLCWLAER